MAILDMMNLLPLSWAGWSRRGEESHDVVSRAIRVQPMNQAESTRLTSAAVARERSMSYFLCRPTKPRSMMMVEGIIAAHILSAFGQHWALLRVVDSQPSQMYQGLTQCEAPDKPLPEDTLDFLTRKSRSLVSGAFFGSSVLTISYSRFGNHLLLLGDLSSSCKYHQATVEKKKWWQGLRSSIPDTMWETSNASGIQYHLLELSRCV